MLAPSATRDRILVEPSRTRNNPTGGHLDGRCCSPDVHGKDADWETLPIGSREVRAPSSGWNTLNWGRNYREVGMVGALVFPDVFSLPTVVCVAGFGDEPSRSGPSLADAVPR